ncbi:hypothetical protein BH10CYA1_BH10CYA1_55980 [soil metagenome]
MKLYRLFSMALVGLTAVTITSLAATASGSKQAFVVPAFCDFGEGQFAQVVNGVLNIKGGPFDDDSAGFTVRTSFAGGANRLDLPFGAGILSFTVTRANNGNPIQNARVNVFSEYGSNTTFQSGKTNSSGFISFDTAHTGFGNPDEIQVAINKNGINMNVSNIQLDRALPLDTTHPADDALGCD